ncbi:biosynthetic arginine decarboxylase [Oceaniserpentilla sp. 4NH20-0058]|uniref:biosynthetic arginine decarboxylase n=1 Tax=Oceaniserpentilla sp. 4NH20-0058 TaxID=3127660 RepID=UPI0031067BEB
MDAQQARDVYNIEHWSEGFFDVNPAGDVVISPFPDVQVSFKELAEKVKEKDLTLPLLMRFPSILHNRVHSLNQAFKNASQLHEYTGRYTSVYPIKVNQQRRVVEELINGQVQEGLSIGLEAGSKPELMAVLAMAGKTNATIVCNGYKDRHYIRLALLGEKLGHKVYLVVEKLSELALILEEAEILGVKPRLGIRARLASIGRGNWQNTGGDKSKFGLSANQILQVFEALQAQGNLSYLQLLHFHLGSQIANIRDIQGGLRECGRIFTELSILGAKIDVVDVGGGLGVDYEGTRSRSFCSMNYSMDEYANNVVYAFKEAAAQADLPHPNIITESGRALTAHHAVLLTNVIDWEQPMTDAVCEPEETDAPIVHRLWGLYQWVMNPSKRSLLEIYHDVQHDLTDSQSAFLQGTLTLQERAKVETYANVINQTLGQKLSPNAKGQAQVLDRLKETQADKLFLNFSLFQSIPDTWGIDQIFPILPLTGLNRPADRRAVIQDITCDSDGRVNQYIEGDSIENTLPMPTYADHEDILMGFFMVGAYQEILGDLHNLFGDTDSVDVYLDETGAIAFESSQKGDTVAKVLQYVNFDIDKLKQAYSAILGDSDLSVSEQKSFLGELEKALASSTYLQS